MIIIALIIFIIAILLLWSIKTVFKVTLVILALALLISIMKGDEEE